MSENRKKKYDAPTLTVVELKAEVGYAASTSIEDLPNSINSAFEIMDLRPDLNGSPHAPGADEFVGTYFEDGGHNDWGWGWTR
ncbi:MAG: hypothetical protein IJ761_00780 [Bacteroidales bacterium]|nr:hypothetical protein [Bacteroidales bacterium]